MGRPASSFIGVCPSCGNAVPNHDPECPYSALATVPEAATREERIREFARKQRAAIDRFVRDILTNRSDTYIDAEPDLSGPERDIQSRPDIPSIFRRVAVLASPLGSSFRVITKGTDEPVLIAGKNPKHRDVMIVNTGQPLLGSQAAIAATNAYIDFSPNMQRDGFWLKPDAAITLPLASDIWALDDGGGTITVLSCILLRAE